MARAGWNLPYLKVNLQYVSSDDVSVMKHFLKMCLALKISINGFSFRTNLA